MNLLKERADEVIALKKAQIVEEESIISFDSENSVFFLHLSSFIWSALDELSDSFWQFSDFGETFLAISDSLSNF